MNWVKTTERLPEKPGVRNYEHVDCLILVNGDLKFRPWNCEHHCWDDEYYDDFAYEALEPTHWCEVTRPEGSSQ